MISLLEILDVEELREIDFAHACNSKRELEYLLTTNVNMLEVDICFGSIDKKNQMHEFLKSIVPSSDVTR